MKLRNERLSRCGACSQALLIALHSWPGLVTLCNPHNTALSSLVSSLSISQHDTQKILLELIYNVFLLRLPQWTHDFEEALASCGMPIEFICWTLCSFQPFTFLKLFIAFIVFIEVRMKGDVLLC